MSHVWIEWEGMWGWVSEWPQVVLVAAQHSTRPKAQVYLNMQRKAE